MKASEKKMIIILLAVAVLVIVGLTLLVKRNQGEGQTGGEDTNAPVEEFVDVLEDGTRLNTSAIFDVYQDNFGEGIFTGKGIYDLEVFSKVLKKEIPENNIVKEEFTNVLEDGTRLNTSTKLHETKKIEGMEISDFQLKEKGNETLLLGTITNVSNTVQGGYAMQLRIIDKTGGEILTVPAYVRKLQPGETAQLNISSTKDFANAYDFTVSK